MIPGMTDTTTLAAVVGSNCRRIREDAGLTRPQLSHFARLYGLAWTPTRIGDIEAGRSELPFSKVLALSVALDVAVRSGLGPSAILHEDGTVTPRSRARVKLADLVAHDGYISLAPGFSPTGDAVAKVCAGKTWELWAPDTAETVED